MARRQALRIVRAHPIKPAKSTRGVSKQPHECGQNCHTSGETEIACDIVLLPREMYAVQRDRPNGTQTVVIAESFACRNKQAAALVMRRFEQFLAELDGYKLPE